MAKRLTDSRKWDDDWFLNLDKDQKLLWIYLLDKCDHAGIFKPNMKLLNFCLDAQYTLDGIIEIFSKRVVVAKGGKLFIPKFISFQYNYLNPNNNLHLSIIEKLKELGVVGEWGHSAPGDKAKAKVKVKVKIKEKKKNITDQDFIDKLKANPAYKHINIDIELSKMDAWLLTHKGRQKTRSFIVNWLNKIDRPLGTYVKPKAKPEPYVPSPKPDPIERAKVAELIRKTQEKMK